MTDIATGRERTITAFFENRADANEAIERLVTAGVPRSDINFVEGVGGAPERSAQRDQDMGFWDTLKDLFLPDEDRYTYAEGLRRGGHLVAVRVSEGHYERALDILDDEGTINIDERAASWKQEGWTGYGPGPSTSSGAAATRSVEAGSAASAGGRTAQAGREEVIPVTEEQLKVGKREVSHGRVRVRSYVVEKPVQEQVNLREEHVQVERRAVDRPATGTEDEFRERTIEAEEKAEEAVVSKDVRVREELVVKKDAEERTETISDKVRRTEVEVEDEREKAARTGERKPR
jgi:stress response protein YsnF